MSQGGVGEQAPVDLGLDLHAVDRRLDAALDALDTIAPGTVARCLRRVGVTAPPGPALAEHLAGVHWIVGDEHPLAYVDPAHHTRLHQAWLTAARVPERVGRARVRVVDPVVTESGGEAPPGWYDVVLIDLIGSELYDAMVVSLQPAEGDEPEAEAAGQPLVPTWVQEGTTFRVQLTRDAKVEGATLNVADLLGRPVQTLVGTSFAALVHPDDMAGALGQWQIMLLRPQRSDPWRVRLLHGDGTWRWFEAISWNALSDPAVGAVVTELRDIEHQIASEEVSRQTGRSHDRLVQVLDDVDDLVMVGRLGGGVLFANQAATRLIPNFQLGVPLATYAGRAMEALGNAEIEPSLRGMRRWNGDLELRLADGEVHVLATTVTPVASGDPGEVYFGIIMRDVTTERTHARSLADQARLDHLTGLPNRLALLEHLEGRCEAGDDVAVLFVDLDNLKIVNDGLGHGAGDRLLAAVAESLLDPLDAQLLARFGGDEFVVVTDGADRSRVLTLADDLLGRIEAVTIDDIGAQLTASVGVAFSPPGHLDPEGLLRDADAAMYEAKRRGRACVAVFDDDLRQRAQRRFTIETSLRRAFGDGTLGVHLQPIVAADTGRVLGFEALARWGQMDPAEFIPIAEESGLILTLGDHVLRVALDAMAQIRAADPGAGPLRLSVNVSGRQLLDRAYAARTLGIVAESGIDAADLILELTESVFIDPRDEVDRALRSLRDSGLSLALDDFGSGYSSLGHLRRYPIDGLKVDTTYTQALLHDPDTRIITEAMVTMANRLGLHLVAEGVETLDELEVVRSLGIGAAQGYLIARPQPVEAVIEQGLDHLGSALVRALDHRPLPA